MSTPVMEPTRVTLGDLTYAVDHVAGDEGMETLQTLLELLKAIARTDTIEEKSKSGRESAIHAEMWLDVALASVRKARAK